MAKEARLSNERMSSLSEVSFVDMFPEIVEEDERLKGGIYRKKHIPFEEIPAATIMDMESIIDAMRGGNSEFIEMEEEEIESNKWEDYTPAPHDLLPFHETMAASVDEDLPIIAYFSSFPGRRHQKITYHRGERSIRTKAGF